MSRSVAERLQPPVRRLRAGRAEAGDAARGRRSLGLAGTAPGFVFDTGPASSSCCPAHPASSSGSGRARSRPSRCGGCSSGRGRRAAACSASTAPASRRSRRRSPKPAETGTGWRRRSARATSRSTSTWSSSRVPRRAPTSSRERSSSRSTLPLRAGRAVGRGDRARALPRPGLTLATAESCTGGLVAARLTSVPGSSDVFLGAVVAYANDVKEAELGVSAELLAEHGAVSAETAAAMAAGVRERLGADVGIAVTGIAGPGGGTPEKPVGLVYLHVETPEASRGLEFSYPADRESIRRARPSPRCTSRGVSCHGPSQTRMTDAASVDGDDRLRLFCALTLPDEIVDRSRVAGIPGSSAPGERIAVPPTTCTSRSPSSATAPRREVEPIGAELEAAARAAGPIRLADAATARLAASGCSSSTTSTAPRPRSRPTSTSDWSGSACTTPERRPWLPHVTVVRFRGRPRLRPPLPDLGDGQSVRSRCLPFRAPPDGAQYVVLQDARIVLER